jgi:hypothetical protein
MTDPLFFKTKANRTFRGNIISLFLRSVNTFIEDSDINLSIRRDIRPPGLRNDSFQALRYGFKLWSVINGGDSLRWQCRIIA